MKPRPFLARESLWWLTLFAPAITLLVSNMDGEPERLERVLGCLLSTWVLVVVIGTSVHFLVNALAPRLASRGLPVTALGLAAAAGALVTAEMLVLLPRLVWLDPNLAGPRLKFVLQALVVAGAYVAGGRLFTWLGERAREAQERARESEARTLRARLAALQAQVNPHFLFNTLNAIASLIPKDPGGAETTVERLASVLQYSIRSSSRSRVTVAEELDAVRDYLEIEQARFGSRLRAEIDVDERLAGDAIPPMLVQPLVENAVLHGLASRVEGGTVTVQGSVVDDAMILRVSDDGVGPGGSKRRGHDVGLANLRERLALTYGDAAALTVGPRRGGGFACEIRVPRAAS